MHEEKIYVFYVANWIETGTSPEYYKSYKKAFLRGLGLITTLPLTFDSVLNIDGYEPIIIKESFSDYENIEDVISHLMYLEQSDYPFSRVFSIEEVIVIDD